MLFTPASPYYGCFCFLKLKLKHGCEKNQCVLEIFLDYTCLKMTVSQYRIWNKHVLYCFQLYYLEYLLCNGIFTDNVLFVEWIFCEGNELSGCIFSGNLKKDNFLYSIINKLLTENFAFPDYLLLSSLGSLKEEEKEMFFFDGHLMIFYTVYNNSNNLNIL